MSTKLEPLSLDRREVVCGAGAISFGAFAGWLMAGSSSARAEPLAQRAPEIDRLTLSTVIDSYQIAVAPDAKIGNVTIKREGDTNGRNDLSLRQRSNWLVHTVERLQ